MARRRSASTTSGERRLDSREQAFLAVADRFAAPFGIPGQQVDLAVGQLRGDVDTDPGTQITATATTQMGDTALAKDELASRLRAGRNDQVLGAVERLEVDLGAERRLRNRDRDLGDEIVLVAHEPLVRGDTEVHVEVAGATSAPGSRITSVPGLRSTRRNSSRS